MTIKDLVNQLKQLDQQKEVKFHSNMEVGRNHYSLTQEDFEINDEEECYYFCVSGEGECW